MVAGVAVVVLVYAAVVLLYASSGRVVSIGEDPTPDPHGVTVFLSPQAVNATGESITMQLTLYPSHEVQGTDSISLDEPLSVIVSPVQGNQSIDFAKDSIPGTHTVTLFAPGAVEQWPFDAYRSDLVVIAYTTVDGVATPIPTKAYLSGYLPGWSLSGAVLPSEETITTAAGEKKVPIIEVTASRSGSTVAFGIVLLGLMVVMPVLVLFVAITAFRGRRKVEASFMSWMGAMLFATIPLRTFLPGSPPIGSWIDFLIVLWVIVGLVSGLVVYVAAWMRWGSPSAPPPPPS
ncbi:DUF4436 domain-containing protein [soil metagenome]